MRRHLILALFCAAAGQVAAYSQTVITLPDGQQVVVNDDGSGEMPAPGEENPGGPAPAPGGKASPRQARLVQLDFDRRPSAILKAWSAPPTSEAGKTDEPPPDAAAAEPAPEAPAEAPSTADPAAPPADPEAAREKAEAAEAQKKKAAEEAAKKAAEAKALDAEMAALQRQVTLGDWDAVKAYLAGLTKEEAKAGYEHLLRSLQAGPKARPNVPQQFQAWQEKNRFGAGDVIGLGLAAPAEPEKKQLATLGRILRQALDGGVQLDAFLALLRPRADEPGFPLGRRNLGRVLDAANEPAALGEFLPSPDEAISGNDREGLNLLCRHYLALHGKDKKAEWLEKAWQVTQAALAAGEVGEEDKKDALKRAVDLAPKVRKELGAEWLDESFTARPERGMEILAAIGTSAAASMTADAMNSDRRLKLLELQTTAAKALLRAAPERAEEWRATLDLLAGNWLREALLTYRFDTSTALGPRMQRDPYGNFYYWDPEQQMQMQMQMQGQRPAPIKTADVLEFRPDDAWLARIEAALQPKFEMAFAQLYLKVGAEDQAFPFIERIAASHPKPAKELVDEFLRVWAKNHDPNSERNRSNRYVYFYGFEERASGIPLTRSKQERNLRDLAACVARLRKLPVELDEKLLAQAFTKAHSVAEVYRLETIEEVFGPVKGLSPAVLAELAGGMRENLSGLWRDPAVQERNKTKRRQQDIQAEVLRGYDLARETVDRALADHPASWELVAADAAIRHDRNNYLFELKKDPEFSARRTEAFGVFHRAAELYARAAPDLGQEKEKTGVYETWFYAALGACDLAALTHEQALAAAEIPLIRDAIAALPGELAERHRGMFANTLFTRMGSVKPAAKFRYVREGLAIAGDHRLARDARDVFNYYNDLVTEIRLETRIDGADRVGHDAPFGLFVDIRHTREIERESGGFSKYLQNQNNQGFAYNYGRPTEDYRDKFEEAARAALQEHFLVHSVTFNDPAVRSRAAETFGWRVTPYAYLLLEAHGPEVDRIPSLRLDLDFLDTSGYAVLPIESSILPIDAKSPAEPRPFENLHLTRTLDERQAKDGRLLLEVKAAARGLPPGLDDLLDPSSRGFEVTKTEAGEVSVVEFADEDEGPGILAERTWTLTFAARESSGGFPLAFTFAEPKVEAAEDLRFRYADADLASVGKTVTLESRYGTPSRAWLWWIPVLLLLGGAAFLAVRRLRAARPAAAARFPLPGHLTAFTVLGYLRDIERRNGLGPSDRASLESEIARLERHFFAAPSDPAPDLEAIARSWSARAS